MAALDTHSPAVTAGHPVHPTLLPLPVLLFAGVTVCDLMDLIGDNGSWSNLAMWGLGAGLVLFVIVGVLGLLDLSRDRKILALPNFGVYLSGNVVGGLIEVTNWLWRLLGHEVPSTGLFELSFLSVVIFAMTVWTGWMMTRGAAAAR